jgi:hypothetical protein
VCLHGVFDGLLFGTLPSLQHQRALSGHGAAGEAGGHAGAQWRRVALLGVVHVAHHQQIVRARGASSVHLRVPVDVAAPLALIGCAATVVQERAVGVVAASQASTW